MNSLSLSLLRLCTRIRMLWKAVDVNANVWRMIVALEVLQLPLLPALPGALVQHTAAVRCRRARGRPFP